MNDRMAEADHNMWPEDKCYSSKENPQDAESTTSYNIDDKTNNVISKNEDNVSEKSKSEFTFLDKKRLQFDDILPLAGEFGLYQVYLLLMMMPFFFMYSFLYYGQMFMTTTSENHWCWVPELENLTADLRRSLAIPDDNSRYGYSRCSMYVANWTEVMASGQKPLDSEIVPCQHGWEFSDEIPYNTISSEYGWVCDRERYQASSQSIFFAGSIVGGFIIGWVADVFGRVPAATLACVFAFSGGIATIYSKGFVDFSLYRFISGMAFNNVLMMVYVLVLEYTAPKYRTLMANLPYVVYYSLAACVMPWIALWCSDWKLFTLVISAPFAIGFLTPLFVPESPRWYLSKGRVEETVEKLLKISKVNKKKLPIEVIEEFQIQSKIPEENTIKTSSTVLLTRPTLRKLFFILCFLFLCTCLVFDGLVRTLDQWGFDFFLSFTLASLTEIPSLILLIFTLDWFGRRWLCILCLSCCCVFIISTALVPSGIPSVVCAVLARFFANIVYNVVIQWATELMPTCVRGTGVAVIHVFGYLGDITSPYIAYLNTYVEGVPFIVLGIVAALGGILALFLPETTGKDMPQSVEDTEFMMKNHSLLEPPVFRLTSKR